MNNGGGPVTHPELKPPAIHQEAEGESDSNWIVSYADMMTLLVGFFALMFSFSKLDTKKFDEIRSAVSKEFGGQYVMPFADLNANLQAVIKEKHLEDKVKIDRDGSEISVVFQGSVLFAEAAASLSDQSKDSISDFLDVLREKASKFPVIVEGHTDDTPINKPEFPSNWELSGARAAVVLRMLETKGFDHKLLRARGFADLKPIVPNRDANNNPIPENQAKNRRITIRILKELPQE
jgi:chemotaxis protein MotB